MVFVRQGAGVLRYEFYIDVFFCVNFFMDLMLLLILRNILKAQVSWRRLAAGSGVGALLACGKALMMVSGVMNLFWTMPGLARQILLILEFVFLELLIPVSAMVWIVFRPGNVRTFVKDVLLLVFVSVCVGGIMESIYQHTKIGYYLALMLRGNLAAGMPVLALVFLAAGTYFLFRYLWICAWEIRRERANLHAVTVCLGGRRVKTMAFLDTGNLLREPESGKAVSIVSEPIWRQLHVGKDKAADADDRKHMIPFRTIGNPFGMLEAMEIDAMEIEISGSVRVIEHPWIGRAPFAVSQDGSYEILLHEDA